MDAAPKPDGEPEVTSAKSVKSELPVVESPPLSPAGEAAAPIAAEASIAAAPAPEPVAPAIDATVPPIASLKSVELPPKIWPRFTVRPRHKRYAVLAASVTFAAALGAVIGALVMGGSPPPVKPDVAAIEQNKAMQQSIIKLNKEIAALKTNLDQANKAAHTQIAKISDKLEQQAAEITGSIAAPQTVSAAPPPSVPMAVPLPRPAQRMAAAEQPGRIPVVADWTIHDYRHGYIFVQGHGEIFQVQIGAPLPGLGPVEAVRRQEGRWVVFTPRGMIVSMRDRRYFEAN